MIYLEPPLHMIDGISVFRDHADPLQWFFLPLAPHVTRVPDPVSGERVPRLQVIRFRSEAGGGGFLNFDVDLGIEPERLDEVAREIKSRESLDDTPRLAPVPLTDGSVRLLLFDHAEAAEGEDTPPPASPEPMDRFVLKATHAAKPSLFGDNRAAFSAQLSPRGVTILEKALLGEMSPIGIVYSLDFVALRPAYHVHMHVDWDRVQHHLEEHFQVNVPLVFQSQIDKIVDELIENRTIEIEVDTFITEGGEGGESIIARRDQAVNDIRDMITETFFEPSLEPIPRQDGTDDDLETAGRIIGMILSGGASEHTAFSYSKTDIKRVDRKRLNVNMSERTAVKRSIYPQGHLSGLFGMLRDDNVDLDRFVISVDADDPWFERRRLTVMPPADFTSGPIRSVNVHLDYGGHPQNIILDANSTPTEVNWPSIVRDGVMQRKVRARFDLNFAGVDGTERPTSLSSEFETVTGDKFEILPGNLYSMVEVPIMALDFPWDRYSHVEVHTRYQDPDHGIDQTDEFLLTSENTETSWRMFVQDRTKTDFSYKIVFRARNHRDEVRSWTTAEDGQIVLRDPFPSKRTLSVVPAVNWTEVDRLFVDLRYEDPTSGTTAEESFEFTQTEKNTQTFIVPLANPEERLVQYRVTIIGKDGSVVEIPLSATFERRITVRGDMRGHRVIRFALEGGELPGREVREITVEARYKDEAHRLSFHDAITLRAGADQGHFEYDYVDDGPRDFEYRTIRLFTNGLTRQTDWLPSDEDRIAVDVAGS